MAVRIGIGTGLAPPLSPEPFWRWTDLCEQAGIDSIWVSDQLLGPTAEPLTLLAALAGRTRRLRLGTNVLVIPFREPLLLAKQIATIDVLSDGRLLPAFGVGNAVDPVWSATARDPAPRGRESDEAIALVRMLLEEEEIAFEGRFFRYRGKGIQPRRPSCPPIWIGGDSEAAIRRSAQLGDGWLGGLSTPEKAGETVARIKAALAGTGRTIDPDHYGITLPFRIGEPDDPSVVAASERFSKRMPAGEADRLRDSFAVGTADHIAGVLRRFIAQGIEKFVAMPIVEDSEDMIAQTRLLAEQIIPQVEGNPARSLPVG